ncbi:MAG: IS6 family transposase [Thaumarchaeota archaeon]|nr:IS6 family transposase [Nitrososphaerota archaeon]
MRCKYCQTEDIKPSGSVNGRKLVKCNNCKHRFMENDSLPKMRVNKHVIVSAINLYYEGLSVRKVSRQLSEIFGEKVSQMTVWKWLQKYSKLVSGYVKTLSPQLSGKWHHDETVIRCDGRNEWFWEMIDEDTRFLVASLLSQDRTLKDTIEVFRKALETSKQRPQALFVDGSHTYDRAFNKVFYTRYKVNRVELVKRVGIRARETNNMVERLHETLKERTKIMRGFKNEDSAKLILEGYAINYNYARPHLSLKGKTPAQEAGIEVKGWKTLIENAIQNETIGTQANTQRAVEAVQVVQ